MSFIIFFVARVVEITIVALANFTFNFFIYLNLPLVIEPILVLNLVRARSSWLGIGTEPPADRSPIRRRIV